MARHHMKLKKCPNCETPLKDQDNFCPKCGQENHELKIPFSHLFLEVFESIFHFETKFFTTLKTIFTRPGRITLDFWNGKRARYMHPFRLYIFVSLVFFLLANKQADQKIEVVGKGVQQFEQDTRVHTVQLKDLVSLHNPAYADSLFRNKATEDVGKIDIPLPLDSLERKNYLTQLKYLGENGLDSLLTNKSLARNAANRNMLRYVLNLVPDSSAIPAQLELAGINIFFHSTREREAFARNLRNLSARQLDSILVGLHMSPTAFNRTLLKQISKINRSDENFSRNLVHAFMKNISLVMFILMPVVAFLLLWVFYGTKRYYFEHLMFSIHAHTILFIVFSLAITIDFFLPFDSLYGYAFIFNWIYFFLSLKTVYGQGWLRTFFKFLLLSFAYLVIVGMFLAAAFVWGFMTF